MMKVDDCTGVVMLTDRRNECRISHQCQSKVVLGGQYWLSVKAVNVRSGVKRAVEASEGLCWRVWDLLMLASSDMFFMLLSHDFIIMMILLFFRSRTDVRRVD